jgi:hypothetical protein
MSRVLEPARRVDECLDRSVNVPAAYLNYREIAAARLGIRMPAQFLHRVFKSTVIDVAACEREVNKVLIRFVNADLRHDFVAPCYPRSARHGVKLIIVLGEGEGVPKCSTRFGHVGTRGCENIGAGQRPGETFGHRLNYFARDVNLAQRQSCLGRNEAHGGVRDFALKS